MADTLISPAVGGALWAAGAGLIAHGARRVRQAGRDRLAPLMGVLGAFVFAAQMINFAIPGTGSSGHLGGGLLLAILLGPHAAFLVMASVLTVQALFFADGGLLALGGNILNLGFFPAYVAYPLVYAPLARGRRAGPRAWAAAILAAAAGLQLGAFGVVLATTLSGITELPFAKFLLLMQPIHLAVGIVEGAATAAVIAFVARARPETLADEAAEASAVRPALAGLAVAAAVMAVVLSWFASTRPDGLEWAIARVTGRESVTGAASSVHATLAAAQEKTAFLPDYGFRTPNVPEGAEEGPGSSPAGHQATYPDEGRSARAGTSVSGLVGVVVTLLLAGVVGLALRTRAGFARASRPEPSP